MDSERVTISNTATEFEEMTVMRQSVAASTPSSKAAVVLHATKGINTHFKIRKITHIAIAMTSKIEEPKVNKSDCTKLSISAAIIGTPPTKMLA